MSLETTCVHEGCDVCSPAEEPPAILPSLLAALSHAEDLMIELSALARTAETAGAPIDVQRQLDDAAHEASRAWVRLRRAHGRLDPAEARRQAEADAEVAREEAEAEKLTATP